MSGAARRDVATCYLVHGEDPGLLSQALSRLLAELEEADSSSIVEQFSEPAGEEEFAIGPILDACRTPPFLTDRRVIVVRDAQKLSAQAERELVSYISDPLETTTLVLVVAGRPTAGLLKAARSAGTVLGATPETKGRGDFFAERIHDAHLRLDQHALATLKDHLGEDLARLDGVLGTLVAAYGTNELIGVGELEPFLGEAGGVAPWELTDAIDKADEREALLVLSRMLGAGGRHPLQVMASLHRHYSAMLALDGVDGLDEAGAAARTGLSPYPAKKALGTARRLGHERLVAAISLLARADLDLRGEIAWPGEFVLEVLVARLAQLNRLGPKAVANRSRQPARLRR